MRMHLFFTINPSVFVFPSTFVQKNGILEFPFFGNSNIPSFSNFGKIFRGKDFDKAGLFLPQSAVFSAFCAILPDSGLLLTDTVLLIDTPEPFHRKHRVVNINQIRFVGNYLAKPPGCNHFQIG